jgi:hypothetical protein
MLENFLSVEERAIENFRQDGELPFLATLFELL